MTLLYAGTREGLEVTDADLIDRAAAGDHDALGALYDRHADAAFRLALRILRDHTLAEDAVQEAFLALWRSAARYHAERATVRSWLLTLVHRRAIDLVRREQHQRTLPPPEEQELPAPDPIGATAILGEERRLVVAALESLPADHRQLLELAYYGGLSQSEIAARLGIPLGTVKSRTFAALAQLREWLAA